MKTVKGRKRKRVALHPEGVDRNTNAKHTIIRKKVALHPEGVDRNQKFYKTTTEEQESPSTRRAWIEIYGDHKCQL